MKKIGLIALFGLLVLNDASSVEYKKVNSGENEKMLQLENKFLQIKILPSAGGRIMSLFYKPAKQQLVDVGNGCLTDNVWNIKASRFFLKGKPYQTTERKKRDSVEIEMKGNAAGGGIDFLEVGKTVKVSDDSAAITIDYKFRNMPAAMAALDYGFWFHNVIGVVGGKTICYYPTDKGIVAVTPEKQKGQDRWFYRPARGWMAAAAPSGTGIAVVMDYSKLKCFYSWYGKTTTVPSLEWRFEKMTLKENESFSTRVRMIPFFGLPKVSGAGQNVVGALEGDGEEIDPGENVPLRVSLYSAIKQRVQVDMRIKNGRKGKWTSIGKKEMVFDAPATVVKTDFHYTPEKEGTYSIELIINRGKQELARLNNWMTCGDVNSERTLEHLKQRVKSTEKKVDLTKFDFSIQTPHVKWAKPYCRGKTRVLALTGYQNIREVVELTERLSAQTSVTYLSVNHRPIYSVGDDYGKTTQSDIYDNLKKQLEKKYDVILIGGVPWDYFPKSARATITSMVEGGTGLVYIDPTAKNEEDLNRISPLKSGGKVFKGVPRAVKKSFLTNGIPFTLFPASNCRKFNCDGRVLAKVDGAPYLATKMVGKGNVVALGYKAMGGSHGIAPGLTPEPLDTKELTGNYWEYYFSLLAKCVIYAAKKLPSTLINSMKSSTSDGKILIDLNLSNTIPRAVTIEMTNLNRYSQTLKTKTVKKLLKEKKNKFVVEMPSTFFHGKQTVNLIIKDEQDRILNWGTVGVTCEPAASLAKIEMDKKSYKHGESAVVTVKTSGATSDNQKISCELVDSNNRVLFKQSNSGANGVFEIPLNNSLLSRFYTIKANLIENGGKVDLLEQSIIVTPSKEQLIWDDYEPGIWVTSNSGLGMRRYLLPQLAKKLHQLKMRTIIANSSILDRDFAIRYNFNPTALMGIGLDRCEVPKEYLKTGDKLKLIRKPCLSDNRFISQRRKAFASLSKKMRKYALRFYWLGDEQSITGYGGKPIDFCFSYHCLSKFRKELKEKYKSVDRLNNEWHTKFNNWNSVLPMTRQEAWKRENKNAAPWADHLNFMDSRLEAMVKLAALVCRENDPNSKISISGTQPPTAYGGMDWWRQMKWFDGVMNYNNGGQRDLQRSFKPNGDLLHWGMGYAEKGGRVRYSLWKTLFIGEKGVMAFHSPSVINPDMTFSTGAKDAVKPLTILTGGVGKHFINNLKTRFGVAIFYSQASIRAAFINKQRKLQTQLREKYIYLCRNVGVDFDFVSYGQVANGILSKRCYKVFILPNSAAMSQQELREIRAFAKGGGIVVAEGEPAIMDEHCRPLHKSGLADIFDGEKAFLEKTIDISYNGALLYPATPKNMKIISSQQSRFVDYLKKGGVAPGTEMVDENGRRITDAEIFLRRDQNDNKYIGVVTSNTKTRQVTFKFPVKSHVYELRTGRCFGNTNNVKLFFSDSKPYLFALLREPPGKLSVDIKKAKGILSINLKTEHSVDNVVNMRVIDSNGKAVSCYEQNILLKNGKGQSKIKFALNDAKGRWTLKFKDVISCQQVAKTIEQMTK